METTKKCSGCKEDLGLSKFGICRRRKDGLKGVCKQCRKLEYQDDRDRALAYQRKYLKEVEQCTPLGRYKTIQRTAKFRGINFELAYDDYATLIWKQPCHYCSKATQNGMDRVDNNGIYTLHNVVPCCRSCNARKWRKPYVEFKWFQSNTRLETSASTVQEVHQDAG